MDGTQAVEGSAAHDLAPHRAGADQQICIHTHHALGQREVPLLRADEFVRECDDVACDRKATQRDMRLIGNAPQFLKARIGDRVSLIFEHCQQPFSVID